MRAAPDPRILTGWSGASPHVLRYPLRAFLRFPVCPPGSSPSSAVPRFPFVRRSPVRSLRPLPGSGSPSVSLRVPFLEQSSLWAIHLSGPDEKRPLDVVVMAARCTKILRLVRLTEYPFLHFSAAAWRFRRRWSRAAGANVTSSAATTARRALSVLLCHLPGLPRAVRPGMASIAGRSPAAEAGPLLALLSAQFPVRMTGLAPRFWHGHLRNVHGLEACLASRWRGIVLGPVRWAATGAPGLIRRSRVRPGCRRLRSASPEARGDLAAEHNPAQLRRRSRPGRGRPAPPGR